MITQWGEDVNGIARLPRCSIGDATGNVDGNAESVSYWWAVGCWLFADGECGKNEMLCVLRRRGAGVGRVSPDSEGGDRRHKTIGGIRLEIGPRLGHAMLR